MYICKNKSQTSIWVWTHIFFSVRKRTWCRPIGTCREHWTHSKQSTHYLQQHLPLCSVYFIVAHVIRNDTMFFRLSVTRSVFGSSSIWDDIYNTKLIHTGQFGCEIYMPQIFYVKINGPFLCHFLCSSSHFECKVHWIIGWVCLNRKKNGPTDSFFHNFELIYTQ